MLLQELGITEPCEIDLEAIACHCGAAVRYRSLDGCEAHIVGYGDRAVITVRGNANPRRRRFSLGHELGHWRYHRGRVLVCRPDDIGNEARETGDPEFVADGYAADLLLPRYLFEPLTRQFSKVSLDAVEELADAFDASLTATAIRLVEFGPAPAMLVCHNRQGRRWFRRGRDVPARWFPRDNLDADSFAFDVLFGESRKSRLAVVGADAWFDRSDAECFEIWEQSIRITPEEIITLLVFRDERMLEDVRSWRS